MKLVLLAPLSRRRPVGALTCFFLSGLCAATLTPAQAQYSLKTIASFNKTNGEAPQSSVTFDSSGNLFGTTSSGGVNDYGTVYEIAKGSTSITAIASFNNTNDSISQSSVTFDSSGNLFGTTASGGAGGNGTVYEIKAGSSTITDLASFNSTNGSSPYAGVTFDGSGNLFGATNGGGASGNGTVFEIAASNLPSAAPEPSQMAALLLTALGLGGLVLRARKRTQTAG